MLEARLKQASLLKKLLDSVKGLVTDANFDCNDTGISLQAMDTSHVALVSLLLRSNAFEHYRCDRNFSLGISLVNLSNILRCAGNNDVLTIKAEEKGDALDLMFEGKNDRLSEYSLKLMDIDSEHLGIPDSVYDATITMSSSEFQRICRDLMLLSESVTISCTKEGVQFKATGDTGSGCVNLKNGSCAGSIDDEEEAAGYESDEEEDEEEEEEEEPNIKVKAEDGQEVPVKDEGSIAKVPKAKKMKLSKKSSGKRKAASSAAAFDGNVATKVDLNQPVSLQFSLKYLSHFTKATPLSDTVTLSLTDDLPMLVEYKCNEVGHVCYFLAPKIGGDESDTEE